MAKWTRNKVDTNKINNGNEYTIDDRVSVQQLNSMVNAGLYAQDFAEHLADTVDTTNINNVGIPNIEFVDNVVDGINYKKFKISNLKGETGEAAGFGVPTINIKTIAADKPAEGSVTATGNNSEKVFHFDLSIPKGADGKGSTNVYIGDSLTPTTDIHFTSDPQTQITNIIDGTTLVKNANNVNGLEITKDGSSGVIKIGDVVIPQKKLLYGEIIGFYEENILPFSISIGDTLMLELGGHIYQIFQYDGPEYPIRFPYCLSDEILALSLTITPLADNQTKIKGTANNLYGYIPINSIWKIIW